MEITWPADISPEILLGLPFDLRTDIYSLGILYIEIASRQLASQSTFARRPPDYALSHDEVWSSVSSVCPRSFVQLALECCDPESDRRPDCKAILRRLRDIEQEVKELEERGMGDKDAHTRGGAAGKVSSHNVGSVSFAGTFKAGSKLHARRPAAAPRLPSFEGALDLKRGSTFAPAITAGAAPSRTEVSLACASSGTEPAANLEADEDAEEGEAVFALARMEVPIDSSSMVSEHGVEANSPTLLRSAHFGAPYGELGRTSGSQLPTFPQSALLVGSSEEVGTATVMAPQKAQTLTIQQAPAVLSIQGTIVSSTGAVVGFKEADEDGEVYHSAFQEQPVPPDESGGFTVLTPGAAHRFSLIKYGNGPRQGRDFCQEKLIFSLPDCRPGLQRFLSSLAGPTVPSGSISRGRWCAHCARTFGLMKAYLACDDCGCVPSLQTCRFRSPRDHHTLIFAGNAPRLASHIKCSDAVPPTCPGTAPASNPVTPVLLDEAFPAQPTRSVPVPPTTV